MTDNRKEGSISARAKIPVEIIDPLNDPDLPPGDGERYLSESYGITFGVVRPLRTNEVEKKRMLDLLRFQRSLRDLWEVYWMKRDAKVINNLFMTADLECNRYVGFATSVEVSTDMTLVWNALKTKINAKMLRSLGMTPGKDSTKLERKKNKEAYDKTMKLWNDNP
jgi:hypothetical protein